MVVSEYELIYIDRSVKNLQMYHWTDLPGQDKAVACVLINEAASTSLFDEAISIKTQQQQREV